MHTRVVNTRIAFDVNTVSSLIGVEQLYMLLQAEGINILDVSLVQVARGLVGRSKWKFGVFHDEMPHFLDCSALTKWVYGQKGIWLPRRSVQQYQYCKTYGSLHTDVSSMVAGDIVFVSSPFRYGKEMSGQEGVGHVGMVIDSQNVICATCSELGTDIVELSMYDLLSSRTLQGIGKPFSDSVQIVTLELPPSWEVESADDIYWIIHQMLHR